MSKNKKSVADKIKALFSKKQIEERYRDSEELPDNVKFLRIVEESKEIDERILSKDVTFRAKESHHITSKHGSFHSVLYLEDAVAVVCNKDQENGYFIVEIVYSGNSVKYHLSKQASINIMGRFQKLREEKLKTEKGL